MSADDARARARELIEPADALIAAPRPQGPTWQVPPQDPPAAAPARRPPAAAAVNARPAAPAGVSRAHLDKCLDALVAGVGKMFGEERAAWRMRFVEAERRLDEVETRLAKLEAKK
jgi:hypothetical protein